VGNVSHPGVDGVDPNRRRGDQLLAPCRFPHPEGQHVGVGQISRDLLPRGLSTRFGGQRMRRTVQRRQLASRLRTQLADRRPVPCHGRAVLRHLTFPYPPPETGGDRRKVQSGALNAR